MRTSRSCSTPAARRACRKARCSRTATSSRTCCRRRRGSGRRSRRDRAALITPLPLYHIFALTANCLLFMLLGWQNVLITNPRDFPAFVAELKKYPFAFISGVNTLFNALLNTPGFEQVDFSELRVTLGGGMAVQASGRGALEAGDRQGAHAGLGAHRDLAGRVHQPLPAPISTARSACRFRRPRCRSSDDDGAELRSAKSARSACAGRR